MRLLFILLSVILLNSCKSPSDETLTVNIERFDEKLMSVKSKEELSQLFNANPDYLRSLYRATSEDTALLSHIYYLTKHPDTQKFYAETKANFGDLKDLKEGFESAFKNIKKLYPEFKSPKIMTTFTGLENDIFVSDSLIIISLEAFNGPKATYRPDQPNYILRRYTKEHILPTVIRFLSTSYNKTDQGDQSFLADIVFFGKSLEFTKQALPNTADSLIMGYPAEDLRATWEAQDLVWKHIIEKELLYTKNNFLKEKYLGERPAVPEIGPHCPGRIGQWLGWRIVKRAMNENPGISFQEMMAMPSSGEILKLSAYRGQTDDDK